MNTFFTTHLESIITALLAIPTGISLPTVWTWIKTTSSKVFSKAQSLDAAVVADIKTVLTNLTSDLDARFVKIENDVAALKSNPIIANTTTNA